MIFTPEERRALLALLALLLLGQAVAVWEEHRRTQPDAELSAWLERLTAARADTAAAGRVSGVDGDSASDPGGGQGREAPGSSSRTEEPGTSAAPRSDAPADDPSEPTDRWSATDSARVEPAAAIPPGVLERGRLLLNAASAPDLEELPGIGPEMAQRILDDRRRRGPFRTPEDLRRVPGIGPKKLARIAPLVTCQPGPSLPAAPRGSGADSARAVHPRPAATSNPAGGS